MNNKVNYTAVGLMVLLGLAMILAFSYWLLRPTADEKTAQYVIYFDESVLGLNIDAPVKYRGISVGRVSKLRINPNNSEQVEVLVTILRSTPVKVDTVAKLTAQWITGLSYINLSMGGNTSKILTKLEGAEYCVIKSVPSFFENFEKSLGSVSTKLSSTLVQTQKLLNDENQEQIGLLLQRSASFMEKMDRILDDKTINSLQKSVNNLESLSNKVDNIMPNVDRFITNSTEWEDKMSNSFDTIKETYTSMGVTMDGMKNAFDTTGNDVSALMPTLDSTMIEVQNLMINMKKLFNQFEKSPSDILYKQEEIKKAPGEY